MSSTEEIFLQNYEAKILDLFIDYKHDLITKEEFDNKIKKTRKLYAKQIEVKEDKNVNRS